MSATRRVAAAALAALAAADSASAASWNVTQPGDPLNTRVNIACMGIGPVSFDACNSLYIGGTWYLTHSNVPYETNYTYSSNGVYASAGVGLWNQIGNLTQFNLNSHLTQWVQDPVSKRLYIWGPSVVDVGTPLIPGLLDYGNGTAQDATNGAGQMWHSDDGLHWTQLLPSGHAYNMAEVNCIFNGSIWAYNSSPPQYNTDPEFLHVNSGRHYRFTISGNNSAWVEVTSNVTGLPIYPLLQSCAVTADQSTLLITYTDNGNATTDPVTSIYYTTDGVTFHPRPSHPWTSRWSTNLVTVGKETLLVGGFATIDNYDNATIGDQYVSDTWSTPDAGQTWTQIASTFGNDNYLLGRSEDFLVVNDQLYLRLTHQNASAWIQDEQLYGNYVFGTLGGPIIYDEATCLRKVTADINSTSTNKQSAASIYTPAFHGAAVVAGLAALLL